jgi:hypothetical protein
MRIVYEIVKVTGVSYTEGVDELAESIKVREDVDDRTDRTTSSDEDENRPTKRRSERLANRENRGSDVGKTATADHVDEVKSSYRFFALLSYGRLMPFEGMELLKDSHV